MYHAKAFDPVPGVISNFVLIPITGEWRYHDQGVDIGSAWREPGYNHSQWPVGAGPTESCLESGSGDTLATDGSPLSAGSGFYYLVQGTNACGKGGYGRASDTSERLSTACP